MNTLTSLSRLALVTCLAASLACNRPGGDAGGKGKASAGEARPVPVLTTKAEKRDVSLYLDGLGSVTAYKTVTVRPQVDGRLDQVLFREGQAVRKGDVLAQIDPRPFQIQEQQALGALARDQAQLLAAQQDLKRYEDLAGRKLVAAQQADDQRALVGQGEGLVRVDQAQLASARLNLDYARITAPIDGVTGIRLVDPGNVVRQADPSGIVVLTQLDPIAVIFTLPQDVLPQVAEQSAQGRKLEVQIFSRDGVGELGRGTLEVIDNAINASTSTLRLKAVLQNPRHLLWPNMFVKARLVLGSRRDALVVPSPAVQRGPEGTFVYVVAEGPVVQPRPVVIERQVGDDVLVSKGLSVGEQVVLEGQNLLRPGSKVAPREAGAPRPAVPREGAARASTAPEKPEKPERAKAQP